VVILAGDCIEQMRELDEASVDAIVCDPPDLLGFMGKEWDVAGARPGGITDKVRARQQERYGTKRAASAKAAAPAPGEAQAMQEWHHAWATEALRVLKPGGHLLAFGGTRTYHRLACAIEDAGFEIRDSLIWIYGSGFPKSLDVSKAIDKAAGAEREVIGEYTMPADSTAPGYQPSQGLGYGSSAEDGVGRPITAPATPEAQQWQGWGTALKPAHEPIVMARKPLAGTVSRNVLEHGTGALNVDGCRIGTDPIKSRKDGGFGGNFMDDEWEPDPLTPYQEHAGRWPANITLSHLPECETLRGNHLCVDDCPVAELDRQSGELTSQSTRNAPTGSNGGFMGAGSSEGTYGDTGGASRFFYTAKASRAERNAGLEGFEPKVDKATESAHSICAKCGRQRVNVSGACECLEPEWERVQQRPSANGHPTVKPIDLMRWLVRLGTPPGGTVLDPFLGSGTTGCAAALEGFDFIGIEREAEYWEVAKARIEWWAQHPVGTETATALGFDRQERKIREADEASGQASLLGGRGLRR
jgi:DNA modification methylase